MTVVTQLVFALFLQQHLYFFVNLLNVFLVFVYVNFVQYSKRFPKNI